MPTIALTSGGLCVALNILFSLMSSLLKAPGSAPPVLFTEL